MWCDNGLVRMRAKDTGKSVAESYSDKQLVEPGNRKKQQKEEKFSKLYSDSGYSNALAPRPLNPQTEKISTFLNRERIGAANC